MTLSGPIKHRNPEIANTAINRNVTMRDSLRLRSNHMRCRQVDGVRWHSPDGSVATPGSRSPRRLDITLQYLAQLPSRVEYSAFHCRGRDSHDVSGLFYG